MFMMSNENAPFKTFVMSPVTVILYFKIIY